MMMMVIMIAVRILETIKRSYNMVMLVLTSAATKTKYTETEVEQS